ncbi:hypothetical protein [Luteimonas vadosa]
MANWTRVGLSVLLLLCGCATNGGAGPAMPAAMGAGARYAIAIDRVAPLRLHVTATLPSVADRLQMSTTRPGGIDVLDRQGWPGIVSGLRAAAPDGSPIGVEPVGEEGWRLAREATGPVTLHYQVDYAPLVALDWPAANESGYADADAIVLAGRSVFITVPGQSASHVGIDAPEGWHVASPWPGAGDGPGFVAGSVPDLVDNLFVLTRHRPDSVRSEGFTVTLVPLGHWRQASTEVRGTVDPIARQYTRLLPVEGAPPYLMVLMPQRARGGESFRNSFAMTVEDPPGPGNRARWGNTLAHELFHYWNGWRLRGKDYAATQWFQEGFTEYMANRAMLEAGLVTPDQFLQSLSTHVANYRRLESTLEAPGTRKGPPLYSGGALTAFLWDVAIRDASEGERDLDDVFAALWRRTDRGARDYDWRDIRAALDATQMHDWEGFRQRHLSGREALPIVEALRTLGLQLVEKAGGQPDVRRDHAAATSARALRAQYGLD